MDATTMQSISSILKILKIDYPDLIFVEDESFSWSPATKVIRYKNQDSEWEKLFHEVGHAIMNHNQYTYDIGLLANEREAWQKAKEIAKLYKLKILQTIIEAELDTYRKWLGDRSTCPNCQSTGIQANANFYACPTCSQQWKVNDAKLCLLRRYKIKK